MTSLPRTIHRIQRLAKRPIQPVTIQQLLARSAAVSDADHARHAAWIREEMPIRLAHRCADFLKLPFAGVCNSRIHEAFTLFLHAFDSLAEAPEISADKQSVAEFATTVRNLVRGHDDMIKLMQEGYAEIQVLFDDLLDLDAFMHRAFFTRIGNRVLAEHFLAVHDAREEGPQAAEECTGVVHPHCQPAEIVQHLSRTLGALCSELYGVEPKVLLVGQLDTKLSFIPEHLNFMLQELLKNAFRATIEHHYDQVISGAVLPHVTVEILKGSFDVTLKISDCGGGMTRDKMAHVWKYGYTSSHEHATNGSFSNLCGQDTMAMKQMAGYGFGLPLSRVYAQYFGGDIVFQSMPGYGTDVYLNINHLGDIAGTGQGARLVAS